MPYVLNSILHGFYKVILHLPSGSENPIPLIYCVIAVTFSTHQLLCIYISFTVTILFNFANLYTINISKV